MRRNLEERFQQYQYFWSYLHIFVIPLTRDIAPGILWLNTMRSAAQSVCEEDERLEARWTWELSASRELHSESIDTYILQEDRDVIQSPANTIITSAVER